MKYKKEEKIKMAEKFKVGDVVRLKSGGPDMVIVCIYDGTNEGPYNMQALLRHRSHGDLICKWYDSSSNKDELNFYGPEEVMLVTQS